MLTHGTTLMATLGGILFPAFAHAREAVKKTNVKQAGSAYAGNATRYTESICLAGYYDFAADSPTTWMYLTAPRANSGDTVSPA